MLTEKEILEYLEKNLNNLTDEEQLKASQFIQKSKILKAREDFYVFLRLMAPTLIPEEFKDGKHIHLFCTELEKLEQGVVNGDKEKLQFFLPPGAMKTLTLCLFVAWVLGRHPEWYIIHVGHTAEFAADNFGQRIRDIILSPEYGIIFSETKIRRDSRKKDNWKTTKGGTYLAKGAGNPIAGKRARLAICDDVLSEQTAISKIERTKINNWYIPGLRSRLLPTGSGEVIVNTRWHMDDLSGHITRVDQSGGVKPWKIIRIPAILTGEDGLAAAEMLGLPPGGSYWPEYWPLDNFLDTKKTSSPATWNALYMQNPVPDEGNIFKKEHFTLWDTVKNRGFPDVDYTIVSFDTAFSVKDSADFSAYQVWGILINKSKQNTSGMMLLDAGKGRWTYPELCEKIDEIIHKYNAQWAIIENKASGQSLIQDLSYQGIPVVPFKPEVDKETRAHACVPFLDAKLVWIPEHETWAKDFLTECLQFPAAQFDDQVDAFTQSVLWMRDNGLLKRPDYVTMRPTDDSDIDDKPVKKQPKTYWKAVIRK